MVYAPGTLETDPKKQNMALQQQAAAISALSSATYVNSINSRTGDITLNATSGITNSSNDIILSQASASQFGAVKVDGTTITATDGVISAATTNLSKVTASLGSNVALNNTANYFDGPSVAQGTSGVWFAEGTVTVTAPGGATEIYAKLWDGTTVIASAAAPIYTATAAISISLSGYITSPAGNIRISCRDVSRTDGSMVYNRTGNSKDCTISAVRIG